MTTALPRPCRVNVASGEHAPEWVPAVLIMRGAPFYLVRMDGADGPTRVHASRVRVTGEQEGGVVTEERDTLREAGYELADFEPSTSHLHTCPTTRVEPCTCIDHLFAVAEDAAARAAADRERLARVEALHSQTSEVGLADGKWCPECGQETPCRTLKATLTPPEYLGHLSREELRQRAMDYDEEAESEQRSRESAALRSDA